jgi:predicted GTPase
VKYWRTVVLFVLLALPVVVFVAVGGAALWRLGWWWWLWWLLPLCWGIAYLLARIWRHAWVPLPTHPVAGERHWTPRDNAALAIVDRQQDSVRDISPERLTDPQLYYETAMELGLQIARHYHPQAQDPVGALTVPEILAVTHLACEDLEKWIQDYVPASHMLSVDQWRMLSKAPRWFRTLGNVSWAVAVLLHPANIARYAASRLTMDSATKQVQANVLGYFYVTFVRRVGFYLIEMNSGRLRGGADRYRELIQQMQSEASRRSAPVHGDSDDPAAAPNDNAREPIDVTIALMGQVKAGKSSLVNALLDEQAAATDILPTTSHVQRFQLRIPGDLDHRLVLLDTPGYGEQAVADGDRQDYQAAFRQADLMLLVMNATNPAREADLRLLEKIDAWYRQDSRRRPPPVIGVLTHIDLLRPATQWSPPYRWQNPSSAKERSISSAVDYHAELLGHCLAGIVPVCSGGSRDRVYGVRESLLPVMTALLDEARACSLLRALHRDLDSGRMQRVFQQLGNAGVELLKSYLQDAQRGPA